MAASLQAVHRGSSLRLPFATPRERAGTPPKTARDRKRAFPTHPRERRVAREFREHRSSAHPSGGPNSVASLQVLLGRALQATEAAALPTPTELQTKAAKAPRPSAVLRASPGSSCKWCNRESSWRTT